MKEPGFEEFGDGFRVTMFRKVASGDEKNTVTHKSKATRTKEILKRLIGEKEDDAKAPEREKKYVRSR